MQWLLSVGSRCSLARAFAALLLSLQLQQLVALLPRPCVLILQLHVLLCLLQPDYALHLRLQASAGVKTKAC